MSLKLGSIKTSKFFANNFKNNTLKAIKGVITNWLPQENPIMRFRSPTLSIEFRNYDKHN